MVEDKNNDDIGQSVMYIFFGGGMVRFFEEDIKDLLPHLLEKDIANRALQDQECELVRKEVERKNKRNEYLSDHHFDDSDIVISDGNIKKKQKTKHILFVICLISYPYNFNSDGKV